MYWNNPKFLLITIFLIFLSVAGSKLFCFKLLTAILHFVLLQRHCHLGLRGSTVPCGEGVGSGWNLWPPPQSPLHCLGTDTQHDVGTPKRQKAAPAWLVAPLWFLQSQQLNCEEWALPQNQGWISEQTGSTADTIMQPGLMVITVSPWKHYLLFYILSLGKILNIYGWVLHFIPPFCQKVVILVSSLQQLQTCESTFSDDDILMRWFNMTDWGHLIWLIKDRLHLLQTISTENVKKRFFTGPYMKNHLLECSNGKWAWEINYPW